MEIEIIGNEQISIKEVESKQIFCFQPPGQKPIEIFYKLAQEADLNAKHRCVEITTGLIEWIDSERMVYIRKAKLIVY